MVRVDKKMIWIDKVKQLHEIKPYVLELTKINRCRVCSHKNVLNGPDYEFGLIYIVLKYEL